MKIRTLLVRCVATVGMALVGITIAWAQEDRRREATDSAREAGPKLGQELSRPGTDEEVASKQLMKKSLESLERLKSAGATLIPRGQHPHHQGCVRATFTIADGLDKRLKVGLFREPRTYQALIRFSNGAALKDNVPSLRGMAIKLLGVEGPSLIEGAADAGTQDFVLVNHPVFFATDPQQLVEFSGRLFVFGQALKAGDSAKAAAAKKGYEKSFALEEEGRTKTFGTPSPLEMSFFSTTPYRLGDLAVKYVATPGYGNASGLPAITEQSSPNALREAMISRLTTGKKGATFTFAVQVQSDPVKMPVENPTIPWDAEPITVATIVIPPQEFAREDQLNFCENLSFTPWHTTKEHQPLGGINRARKEIYQAMSKFRHDANQENDQIGSKAERKEPVIADLDRLFKLDAANH